MPFFLEKSTIFLPKSFDGTTNELILKVAHSNKEVTLFWSLNNIFLGTTKEIHHFAIQPTLGAFIITVTDSFGNEIQQEIEIKG